MSHRPHLSTTGPQAGSRVPNQHSGFHPTATLDILLLCVDVGLFAAIFLLPFVMGGRQAIGEFALTGIAAWTASAWLFRQTIRGETNWRLTGMTPLMLIGIALVLMQTVTLAPQTLQQLSPHLSEILPAWHEGGPGAAIFGGQWSTISLTPVATQRSLVCVICCALLFLVTVNRLQTLKDVHRATRAIAVAATLMAIFGTVQYLTSNSLFFWVYEHPYTQTRDYAKGAFTNPNHFADYLAMALPLLLAWFAVYSLRQRQGPRDSYDNPGAGLGRIEGPAIALCLGCVSTGILLSQSRGGLLAACGGVAVCLFLLHRVRALTGRTAGMLGGMVCAALLSLMLFGDRIVALVEANFQEIAAADMEQLDRGDSRQKIWQAAIAGIRDYPLFGTGLSSHREVYWTYFDHPDDEMEFSHAENGYLQLALETGFAGIATAGCCLMLWLLWCLRGIRRGSSVEAGALLAAIIGVIVVNLAHSVTDFIWYAPGIMVAVVMLAACAAALDRLSRTETVRSATEAAPPARFHLGWGVAFSGVVLLSGWMLQVKWPAVGAEPHWFAFVRLVQQEDHLPDDADLDFHQHQKFAAVLQAARADRNDARIQLRAARTYLALFELQKQRSDNPMSLIQIQDAALASEWTSPEEMNEWLNRPGVLGEHRKYLDTAWKRAAHALSLCPLQADGYLVLGDLAWIHGLSLDEQDQLLTQALVVRPYDPQVHYVAGRTASLRGNEEAALAHWSESFDRSDRFRRQITQLLAPVWPARRFLDQFEPDTAALIDVVSAYRDSPDVDGYRHLSTLLADGLCEQAAKQRYADAVRTWRQAHARYLELGDAPGADRTARAAVEADPNSLPARRTLAMWLFSQEEYAAAVEHLNWCHRRSPNDREVEGWLNAALTRQHTSPRRVAGPTSTSPLRRQ